MHLRKLLIIKKVKNWTLDFPCPNMSFMKSSRFQWMATYLGPVVWPKFWSFTYFFSFSHILSILFSEVFHFNFKIYSLSNLLFIPATLVSCLEYHGCLPAGLYDLAFLEPILDRVARRIPLKCESHQATLRLKLSMDLPFWLY